MGGLSATGLGLVAQQSHKNTRPAAIVPGATPSAIGML